MFIPNVREKQSISRFEHGIVDNPYYEGNLKDKYNLEYLRGYDYVAEEIVPCFFDNLDVYEDEFAEIGTGIAEKVADILKECLADWIERDRNELVVYMIEKEDEVNELSEETKRVLADD